MPILSRDPLFSGEQTQTRSTTGEVVGAAFDEALHSGLAANFFANASLDDAEFGRRQSDASRARFGDLGVDVAPSPHLGADAARQQLRDAGLEHELTVPDGGIGQETLRILMDRKRAELRRRTINAQAEGGFWQGSARLGAGFAGSLVDPTNIALAFVPVVGEARYAELLASAGGLFGRTAVRGTVGALEGTLGLLPTEAYNYYTKQREQADYSAYDALSAIAGGAVFGAALHSGAGFLGDTAGRALGFEPSWSGVERARRQGRLDTLLPEATTERVPTRDVPALDPARAKEARERAMILDRLAEGRPLTREDAQARALATVRDELRAELQGGAPVAAGRTGLVDLQREQLALESDRRQRIAELRTQPGTTARQAAAQADAELEPRRLDLEARRARAESQLAQERDRVQSANALAALERGEVPESLRTRVTAEADRLLGSTGEAPLSAGIRQALGADPFLPVRPFIAHLAPETQQRALRMAIAQTATGRAIDVTPALLGDPAFGTLAADVAPLIRERASADGHAAANLGASQAAAQRLADAPRGDQLEEARTLLAAEESELHALARQRGLDLTPYLEAAEHDAAEARTAGRAAQGAALCLMRTG